MCNDEMRKSIQELNSIEKMLSTLTPYSDDWFVWNELRIEEERRIRCLMMSRNRINEAKNRQR